MEGLAPSGCCYEICPTSPANGILARYCFGGAIPAHLGSTNPVNTVVIAHPAKLTSDQIRAIKVVFPRSAQLSVSLASFLRSPLLGCWPKVNHDQYYFSTCMINFSHSTQTPRILKIKMFTLPKPYLRRRRSTIALTMSSGLEG